MDRNFCINFFLYRAYRKLARNRDKDDEYILSEYRSVCGQLAQKRKTRIYVAPLMNIKGIRTEINDVFNAFALSLDFLETLGIRTEDVQIFGRETRVYTYVDDITAHLVENGESARQKINAVFKKSGEEIFFHSAPQDDFDLLTPLFSLIFCICSRGVIEVSKKRQTSMRIHIIQEHEFKNQLLSGIQGTRSKSNLHEMTDDQKALLQLGARAIYSKKKKMHIRDILRKISELKQHVIVIEKTSEDTLVFPQVCGGVTVPCYVLCSEISNLYSSPLRDNLVKNIKSQVSVARYIKNYQNVMFPFESVQLGYNFYDYVTLVQWILISELGAQEELKESGSQESSWMIPVIETITCKLHLSSQLQWNTFIDILLKNKIIFFDDTPEFKNNVENIENLIAKEAGAIVKNLQICVGAIRSLLQGHNLLQAKDAVMYLIRHVQISKALQSEYSIVAPKLKNYFNRGTHKFEDFDKIVQRWLEDYTRNYNTLLSDLSINEKEQKSSPFSKFTKTEKEQIYAYTDHITHNAVDHLIFMTTYSRSFNGDIITIRLGQYQDLMLYHEQVGELHYVTVAQQNQNMTHRGKLRNIFHVARRIIHQQINLESLGASQLFSYLAQSNGDIWFVGMKAGITQKGQRISGLTAKSLQIFQEEDAIVRAPDERFLCLNINDQKRLAWLNQMVRRNVQSTSHNLFFSNMIFVSNKQLLVILLNNFKNIVQSSMSCIPLEYFFEQGAIEHWARGTLENEIANQQDLDIERFFGGEIPVLLNNIDVGRSRAMYVGNQALADVKKLVARMTLSVMNLDKPGEIDAQYIDDLLFLGDYKDGQTKVRVATETLENLFSKPRQRASWLRSAIMETINGNTKTLKDAGAQGWRFVFSPENDKTYANIFRVQFTCFNKNVSIPFGDVRTENIGLTLFSLYRACDEDDLLKSTLNVLWQLRARSLAEECEMLRAELNGGSHSLFFEIMKLARIGNKVLRHSAVMPFSTCVSEYEKLDMGKSRALVSYNMTQLVRCIDVIIKQDQAEAVKAIQKILKIMSVKLSQDQKEHEIIRKKAAALYGVQSAFRKLGLTKLVDTKDLKIFSLSNYMMIDDLISEQLFAVGDIGYIFSKKIHQKTHASETQNRLESRLVKLALGYYNGSYAFQVFGSPHGKLKQTEDALNGESKEGLIKFICSDIIFFHDGTLQFMTIQPEINPQTIYQQVVQEKTTQDCLVVMAYVKILFAFSTFCTLSGCSIERYIKSDKPGDDPEEMNDGVEAVKSFSLTLNVQRLFFKAFYKGRIWNIESLRILNNPEKSKRYYSLFEYQAPNTTVAGKDFMKRIHVERVVRGDCVNTTFPYSLWTVVNVNVKFGQNEKIQNKRIAYLQPAQYDKPIFSLNPVWMEALIKNVSKNVIEYLGTRLTLDMKIDDMEALIAAIIFMTGFDFDLKKAKEQTKNNLSIAHIKQTVTTTLSRPGRGFVIETGLQKRINDVKTEWDKNEQDLVFGVLV